MSKNDNLQNVKIACSSGSYELEIAVKNLIENMQDVSTVIEIVAQNAFRYLELFEEDHPDIKYPRILLSQVQNRTAIDLVQFGRRDKYVHSYNDLCSNLFDSGLDYLEDAYNAFREKHVSKAKGLLSISLCHLIGAFEMRFWQINNPETYEIWQKSADEIPDEQTYAKIKKYKNGPVFKNYRKTICERLIADFSTL